MAKIKRNYTPGKPSVTTVIGRHLGWKTQGLIGWAHKLGQEGRDLRERDDAAAKGSCAHDLVAAHYAPEAHGDLSEWRSEQIDEAKPNAERVIAEITRLGWDVIGVETAMENARYAGTLDLLVRDADGLLMIADLKTSRTSAGAAEWVVQIAAYARLHADTTGEVVTRGAVLHAPYGADLAIYPIDEAALDAGALAFSALLSIHEVEHAIRVGARLAAGGAT